MLKRHATGLTLALAVAVAVALSLAPVPDVFRPFPTLRTEPPLALFSRLLLPSRGDVREQDAVTGAPDAESPENIAEKEEAVEAPVLFPASGTARLYAGLPSFEVRRAGALDRLADRIGASRQEIEEGCAEGASDGTCRRRALDNFFERLHPLRRGDGKFPVRIVHLGDSQIASDYIADLVRRRLEFRYGSSGRGFLFVDRPTHFSGKKVRTGEASEGWAITRITDRDRSGILGFSGVRFTAADGQRTRFEVGTARFVDLAFVTSQTGGSLEVTGDGRRLASLLTRFEEPALAFSRLALPAGIRTLALHTASGEVSLLGAALENGFPGIVYDTIGLPGAMFEVFLRSPERSFQAHLARRDPSLVVIMLGGNESYEIGRGWQKVDTVRTNARKLVQRIQSAVPAASCLLLSPLDAGVRSVSGAIQSRAPTRQVADVIREVALASGCAFWDAHQAMGGEGSAARWYGEDLFQPDLVHPRRRGADLLAHLFDTALEQARQTRRGMLVTHVESAQIEDASGTVLRDLFERTAALEIIHLAGEPSLDERTVAKELATSLPSARPSSFRSIQSIGPLRLASAIRPETALVVLDASLLSTFAPDREVRSESVREETLAFVAAVREAAPNAACLLAGPPDRLRPLPGGGNVPDESVDISTRVLREVAATEGCAFWSARAAMGGRGAIRRWQTLEPAWADAAGLTRAGVEAVGRAFAEELLAAWRAWSASTNARAQAGAGPAGGAR